MVYLISFGNNKFGNHCFVYVEKGEITVCENQALLNELIARKSKKVGVAAALEDLGGVAGIIGLIVTLTTVYLVVSAPDREFRKYCLQR
ncbi:hypothetical protein O5O45_00135 [Hahella aquimaris]|uniref:hypothetical protein n=1 Tax=Hahella sp. HNIBRBA332 TaxID=3015983 RepID=UPI00273B93BD|nr:hypothetical protein [Hahella sp. HNIBRBA332]WLQ14348.1 hypothetical protein O5O45_00135 [Hahella sp. HNIBRBA332]